MSGGPGGHWDHPMPQPSARWNTRGGPGLGTSDWGRPSTRPLPLWAPWQSPSPQAALSPESYVHLWLLPHWPFHSHLRVGWAGRLGRGHKRSQWIQISGSGLGVASRAHLQTWDPNVWRVQGLSVGEARPQVRRCGTRHAQERWADAYLLGTVSMRAGAGREGVQIRGLACCTEPSRTQISHDCS